MSTVRIALANLRVPATPDESVGLATAAISDAGNQGATVLCFPECFVPGYRWPGTTSPGPDPVFLERAWAAVGAAARGANVTVILGTERVTQRGLQVTACVFSGREYVLRCVGELRERGFRHHVGHRSSGWHATVFSTLRTTWPPRRGSGSEHSDRTAGLALSHVTDVTTMPPRPIMRHDLTA